MDVGCSASTSGSCGGDLTETGHHYCDGCASSTSSGVQSGPPVRDLPPLTILKKWNPSHPFPTVNMMKQEGDYYPDLSYSYNVELFFWAKCAGSDVDCDLIDRFYHNYKDVHGIPDNPCALTSLCQDLPALLAAAGVDGEGAAGACSFAPTTPVLLANGKAKPIGDLKVGDQVEAADPNTGKDEGGRTVQHVWINHDNDLLDVTVTTGSGRTSIIHTTANHPFWDDTTQSWVAAGNLEPGDALASTQGQHPTVLTIKATPGAANRYNLTVQQLHTYYVLAGSTPILVHNSTGTPNPPPFPALPSLDGMSYSDAVGVLADNGFSWVSDSGSYVTFRNGSGTLTIKSENGRVTRTTPFDPGDNIRNRPVRWNPDGTSAAGQHHDDTNEYLSNEGETCD
ncbi:polymorphic toxin-type HINT domain-containing protein [Streptacidiphilus sp. PAMC 29251]